MLAGVRKEIKSALNARTPKNRAIKLLSSIKNGAGLMDLIIVLEEIRDAK